jgi:glycosyltransferase involved in cell wall biosynthesis
MANSFLSVVVPTYNRKDSLRVTLDALGKQTPLKDKEMPSFEVVVISDGSTDGTEKFLAEYQTKAPYSLRWLQQQNGGPARARNRGFQEATGEIIVFLDDDVEPEPQCLAAHAIHHEKDHKIIVIGPMSPDPALSGKEPVWIAWEHEMLQKQYRNFIAGVWQTTSHNYYTGNVSQRREHLLAVGGFNEKFTRMEDVELAVRMEKERGVHFTFDPATNVWHRPMRSFSSWLNVAYSYGGRLVERAKTGEESWRVVADNWTERNKLTLTVASVVCPRPSLSAPTERWLKSMAERLYAQPGKATRAAALAMLSVLYNVRLLEGARDQIGSWVALQERIRDAANVPADSTSDAVR